MFQSGTYRQQYRYKSFLPNPINVPYRWEDKRIDILLSEATLALGELNAYAQLVPDVDFFIRMHVAKEATESSRIEGTRTEIDEAMMSEESISPERRDDWQEVQNYIKALSTSIKELEKLSLSWRLLRNTHAILLSWVRGKNKQPGEIRVSQNWIGGANLESAFFIPPHPNDLSPLLSDIEKFWYNETLDMPPLIKMALSHYQFETLHPFLDGNGRLGRLLIILQLVEQRILSKPAFHLSDFFERNRVAYYDSLTLVRTGNNIEQWLRFFLSWVIETAKKSVSTLSKIVELRQWYEEKIAMTGRKAKNLAILIRAMYTKPVVTLADATKLLYTTPATANSAIKELVKIGILKETTGYSRNRMYEMTDYLQLFR